MSLKKYLDYFKPEKLRCEICSRIAKDIYKIEGKDDIRYLISLCPECESAAESGEHSTTSLKLAHNTTIAKFDQIKKL